MHLILEGFGDGTSFAHRCSQSDPQPSCGSPLMAAFKMALLTHADHCGLHRTYMGGIERGERNLTIQTVYTVAKGLELTLAELFKDIEREGVK